MKLLSAQNISHTFECELFSNVSLELNATESIAIVGMSGSGKSTLLHILSTLLKPDSGAVHLFGENVATMSKKRLSLVKRDALGLVFQSHYLFKGFSAYENLEVAEILSQNTIDPTLLKYSQSSKPLVRVTGFRCKQSGGEISHWFALRPALVR